MDKIWVKLMIKIKIANGTTVIKSRKGPTIRRTKAEAKKTKK